MAIKEIRKVFPLLAYFTKNGGINSVTSAAAAGYIPLASEILNNAAVLQGIDQLSTANTTGAVIATVFIGARAALGFYRSLSAK